MKHMKNTTTSLLMGAIGLFAATLVSAQCPTISCPSNITVNNDSGSCGAVVTFAPPSYSDPCNVGTVTFSYTGAIANWTVPAGVTSIHIVAKGASGGNNGSSTIAPGLGASMSGDFAVTPGQQLKILVGQNNNAGNGGGGGTFVTDMSNTPLIIAGGGGGGSATTDSPNKHGQSGTSGGNGAAGGGNGGTAGSGGFVGTSGFQSGAGGGLLTNGQDGWTAGSGGQAFVNGGAGANVGFGIGGFGGGGNGSGYVVGGGGGGYSGGGGGGNSSGGVGGGGGSYNAGTNQVNATGNNSGNGSVVITYSNSSSLSLNQIAGLSSGSNFPAGVTNQTFVVSDGLGNNDTCTFTVTVNDIENPVFTCPSNITVNADSGMCSAVVTFNAPAVNDNCSVASNNQTAGLPSGSAFPVGTTTVTYLATDGAGNTSTCSFDVIVTDTQAPVFSCPGTMNVNADPGMCTAIVNFNAPVATDNCNVASVTQTSGNASGTAFPLGATTISFTATDSSGNSTVCSFNVVVSDAEAPVMTCPGTITMNADSGMCSAVVTFNTPTATDNCSSATVTQTGGLSSGSAFPVGTTTVTYTASDSTGNTSTCSFDVIVVDNTAPVLQCPNNVTSCSGSVTGIAASASDLCSGASVTYTLSGATTGSGSGDASGNFNTGTTTVVYTATDSAGNSSTCSFTITVNPLPVITVSAAASVVCVDDAPVALTATPAGGSWSGPGVTGSSFNPNAAGTGAQSLTYTYTDTSTGCTNTGSLTIDVNACTGITETAGIAGMQVFPNPTSGDLQINFARTFAKIEIIITQVNGQRVRDEQFSQTGNVHLSVGDLASGIYFMTVKAGDATQTLKLIRN